MTGNDDNAIMIFSDNIHVQDSAKDYKPFQNCMTCWQHYVKDNVKLPKGAGHMYPVRKLYCNCCVYKDWCKQWTSQWYSSNFWKIILKLGQERQYVLLDENIPVPVVHASQVSYIVLHHTNDCIRPSTVSLQCKQHTFKAKILKPHIQQVKGGEREFLQMKGTQLPLLINNATTGQNYRVLELTACLFITTVMFKTGFTLCFHEWRHVQDFSSAENHSADI
jgi:hypothetical protein